MEKARFTGYVVYPYDTAALALDNDGLVSLMRQDDDSYDVEEIDVDVEGHTYGQREAKAWDECERIMRETLQPNGRLVHVEERFSLYY